MSTAPAGSCAPMIASGEMDSVSAVLNGNKVEILVPLERTAGGSGKKVRVEVPRNWLIPSARSTDHAQLLVQNHQNFKVSGMPARIMMFKDGSWVDFEKSAMDVLVSAFVSGEAMVETVMGGFTFIFDFYRMIGINLDSGNELPIAWIDVGGNSFYPKVFVEGSENLDKNEVNVDEKFSSENGKVEFEIKIIERNSAGEVLGKRKMGSEENEVVREVGSSSRDVIEQRVVSTPTELLPPKWPRTRSLGNEEESYRKASSLLISILKVGVTVTAVHQCTRTGPVEQARLEVFVNNAKIVKRRRGDPSVQYAWYGTSSAKIDSIMRRGFEMPRIIPGIQTHGVGIYMSPLYSPQKSHMMCEVDENGEKHIMLCRVIVGKLEKVELGSQQLFPSSAEFDTGVDDLINPKLHVIWCSNMNTHILPIFIVSYKSGCHMSG
ncbi:inactive poly [ADP-ribose] polymerase RCD1-like [Solanum lycopersicum]|uniref:Poly [ADP-ribose] polymerase n=1 Tax=Solanum lycopersicum TaxID=4081 RepID=A0A3Q7H140_SOLLC|nr:inactive poly [ADP-ribose] polymerase RCD1-like [Solanum lycopersicum]